MGACCGGSKAGKDGKQGGKIESMPVMKKPKGGPMVDKSKVTDSKKEQPAVVPKKSESEAVDSVPKLSKAELDK
jgi:hypothetical protein